MEGREGPTQGAPLYLAHDYALPSTHYGNGCMPLDSTTVAYVKRHAYAARVVYRLSNHRALRLSLFGSLYRFSMRFFGIGSSVTVMLMAPRFLGLQ